MTHWNAAECLRGRGVPSRHGRASSFRFATRAGLLATCLLAAAGSSGLAATGGPDVFGYTWADDQDGCDAAQPAFQGRNRRPVLADSLGPIALGFDALFHGQWVNQAWISPHGYITFSDQGMTQATGQLLPNALAPNHLIAAHWTSVAPARVTAEDRSGEFHVRWEQGAYVTDLLFFETGDYRILWSHGTLAPDVVVGHEDRLGALGSTLTRHQAGTQTDGDASFPDPARGASVCVSAPVLLDCAGARTVACTASLPAVLPTVDLSPASSYACTGTQYLGNELVFRVDVPALTSMSVSIDHPNLDLFQVDLCNATEGEETCLQVADDRLDFPIAFPQTYWFVVDKETAGGGEAFVFDVQCTNPFQPVACGDTAMGDTMGGSNFRSNYPCAATLLSGPERYYRVSLPAQDTLVVTAESATPGLWVAIYDAATFEAGQDFCLAAGLGGTAVFDAPAGDYIVAVDGEFGAAGSYELSVNCGRQLDCAAVIDVHCTEIVSGDTSAAPRAAAVYTCVPEALPGGELLYRFHNPSRRRSTRASSRASRGRSSSCSPTARRAPASSAAARASPARSRPPVTTTSSSTARTPAPSSSRSSAASSPPG